MTTKELQAIAKEFNTILNLSPNDQIKANNSERTFKAEFKDCATLLVFADLAKFQPSTVKYLKEIGAKLPKGPALTAEQKEQAKKEREAEKAAAAARKAAGAYTRSHALHEALCKGGTKAEIIALADDLFFQKHPDKTRPKVNNVSRDMFGYSIPLAVINGSVTVTGIGENKVYRDTASILLETATAETAE